jgi:hypothetical protein
VHYVRLLSGHAGYGFNEWSPGEDVLAVDCSVEFPVIGARVQVKSTRDHAIDGNGENISMKVTRKWLDKWQHSAAPVYFVVVVVPQLPTDWIDHSESSTILKGTCAYWCQIDVTQFNDNANQQLHVPRAQRLTAETFGEWDLAAIQAFGGGGV